MLQTARDLGAVRLHIFGEALQDIDPVRLVLEKAQKLLYSGLVIGVLQGREVKTDDLDLPQTGIAPCLKFRGDHISDGTQSYAGLPVQQDIAAFFAEKDADDSLDDITADDDRTLLRAQILALTDLQRKHRLDHIRFPDTPDHGENLLGLHVEDSFKEILDFGLVTSHNSRKDLTLSPSCLAHFQGGLYCRFQDLVGSVSKT